MYRAESIDSTSFLSVTIIMIDTIFATDVRLNEIDFFFHTQIADCNLQEKVKR